MERAGWWWMRRGVGAPVVERARGSGERWQVPRKDLLAGLEVLLETGELRISKRLVEAGRLVKELTSIRFGRGESGEHDDLTMAVGLACWRARRSASGFGTRRLPGI